MHQHQNLGQHSMYQRQCNDQHTVCFNIKTLVNVSHVPTSKPRSMLHIFRHQHPGQCFTCTDIKTSASNLSTNIKTSIKTSVSKHQRCCMYQHQKLRSDVRWFGLLHPNKKNERFIRHRDINASAAAARSLS